MHDPEMLSMVGRKVWSQQVGKLPPFFGTITGLHSGSVKAWIVRNSANNSPWHRERDELVILDDMSGEGVCRMLGAYRMTLANEKALQGEIETLFKAGGVPFKREVRLDPKNRIDFMVGSIGLEIKLKSQKRAIFEQIERYAQFPQISELVLATNQPTGMPPLVNGKRVRVLELGKAWL